MAAALRVLLRQKFNPHPVLARAEILRQQSGLAIARPACITSALLVKSLPESRTNQAPL